MRRLAEVLVFGGAAVGLHLAAAAWAARAPQEQGTTGGAGGEELVQLLGASAQIEARVRRWEAPPEVSAPELALAQPEAPALPEASAMAPDLPPAPPGAPSLPPVQAGEAPSVETASATPQPKPQPKAEPVPSLAPKPRPEPAPQPERRAEPAPEALPAQDAREDRQAAGAGGGATAGTGKAVREAQPSKAQVQKLRAVWGGQVRQRITAKLVVPKKARGTVVLRITVTPGGRITRAGIARTSGSPAIDQAAIGALQRAGRVARAPKGLNEPSYTFDLPIAVK